MNRFTENVLDAYGSITLLNAANAFPRDSAMFDAHDTDPALVARQSFNVFGEERAEALDLKLLEYLEKNMHTTPLEMTELWFSMKLPLFVADQFKRHRSAKLLEHEEAIPYLYGEASMYNDPTINQASARYITLPREWYIPQAVGAAPTNGAKQGQSGQVSIDTEDWYKNKLNTLCRKGYNNYVNAINSGVAPEHARLFLHVNHYTVWVWKQDLHNLMHFMMLRLNPHAQIEARAYALAMYNLMRRVLPKTMELFDTYRMGRQK